MWFGGFRWQSLTAELGAAGRRDIGRAAIFGLITCSAVLGLPAAAGHGQTPLGETLRECRADEQARPASTSNVTLPEAGRPGTAEIGSPMISYIREERLEAGIRLDQPLEITGQWAGGDWVVTIAAGEMVAVDTRKGTVFVPREAGFRYLREKKPRSGLGRPDIGFVAGPAGLVLRLNFGLKSMETPVGGAAYQTIRCRRMGVSGFRRELIFGGATKGVIRLQYREYMGGLARAPFAQELTYDLADGHEIGFKGARINVVRVSNTGIEYVVMKPFD